MDYIYLQGSESVERASSNIRQASTEMAQAAATIDAAMSGFRVWAEDYLSRLQSALDELKGETGT